MPQGDKFQGVKPKKDDAEYPAWQRSLVVVRGRESRLHGEGRQDVNQLIKRKGA